MALRNDVATLNQLVATGGENIITGTPTASATKALLRMGNALVSGNANGAFLGWNTGSGYTGDHIRIQLNSANHMRVDSVGRLILGERTTPLYKLEVAGAGDDTFSGSTLCINTSTGSSAAAIVNCDCGQTTNEASGFFGVFNKNNGAQPGMMGLFTNADANGILLRANIASQTIQFQVGNIGEQMRLSTNGELLIGATSSIARFASVGRSDQIQGIFRAFSTQTSAILEAQLNAAVGGGTLNLWNVTGSGNQTFARTSSTTSGRETARIESGFVVSTDATRTGFLQLIATDFNAARTCLRIEADGTNPRIGFLGATPKVRPTYTVTNLTVDRSYDANATTLDEIADVLGTLLSDLGSTSGFGLLTI